MFFLRRDTYAVPRRAPRRAPLRAWHPVVRRYATDAESPAPVAQPSTPQTPAAEAKPESKPVPKPAPKLAPKYASNNAKSNPAAKKPAAPVEEPPVNPNVWERSLTGKGIDIDWSSSYHGIATKPVTGTQYKILVRPIPEKDIEVKPEGILYLPEIKYRRRLNEAFGPMGWGLIPRGEANVGAQIVTREYALIVEGRFVSHAQGENSYFNDDQLPSAIEGCKSNALMRCCKDLGIASELWDPEFIRNFRKNGMTEVWVEHVTTKKKRVMWFKNGLVNVVYPWKLA